MVWDKRWLLVLLILVTITVFNGMRQEVIACFVDIGDHHCIQWYETRGDYLWIQWWSPISTKQVITSHLIPLNTVMVTNINKTSNHRFVDIGDHHCIQWYETRGDYLFCWYWWPSLYSMVWGERWLLVLLILVTITVLTSNHLSPHTIEYSDGHQYQQNK
jgi:hypothetical protein